MIFLKGCFIGGLKKELKYDVKLLKPATVHDAIAFAVQLDVKIYEFKSTTSKPPLTVKPHITFATPVTRTVPHHGNLDVKKLFPDEIQKKREQGECWFCTDKWCIMWFKQLLMLDVLEFDEIKVETQEV